MNKSIESQDAELNEQEFIEQVLSDYYLVNLSREISIIGRKEVLTGKAKFGIFGDGKELPQVVAAKFFRNGDFRSGYYRDQTFMFATGMVTPKEFFAQLYANPDSVLEPASSGRQMNGHFATRFVNEDGSWIDFTKSKNCTSDISPTAGQMVRGLGIAFASKVFRENKDLSQFSNLSDHGNEVSFVTIGDASTSEGHFWETINAAGVMQVPLAVFVWDDGYGISVPQIYQTTKQSISQCLSGMEYTSEDGGLLIYKIKAWDYVELVEKIEEGINIVREHHIPALFHISEVTQPQGHSTSGSHERYKSSERLQWEKEWDCILKMKEFILDNHLADESELDTIQSKAQEDAKKAKSEAWEEYQNPIKKQINDLSQVAQDIIFKGDALAQSIANELDALRKIKEPFRKDIAKTAFRIHQASKHLPESKKIQNWISQFNNDNQVKFSSNLYSSSINQVKNVEVIQPIFSGEMTNGFEILNEYFKKKFTNNPKLLAFGEDVGYIGDVNQGFAGLQELFGKNRIFDTGIREASIMGQGIGLAMRGLRPITEIQYLDYLLYALQTLSDDVASLEYRTNGKQKCPIIIRTRGHRLEGIWHSGSPMGMILNALRGINICVPRNMTQAAGMYNTLLLGDEPGLVIECLNGYRLKENKPSNLDIFTVPLGEVEVLMEGEDVTIVSYGSTLRIVEEAIDTYLSDVSIELIDVQTLMPFDTSHRIAESLKKTNRLIIIDEDVSSGASAFIYNQIMEIQNGYYYLDVPIRTLTAKDHRSAYGTDGDYFSKPNAEDVATMVWEILST